MRRITEVKDFDRWANDPVMQAQMGGPVHPLDNQWFYDHGLNVALEHDGCCMPFVRYPRVGRPIQYDMHFLFPRNRCGKRALAAARKMLAAMFTTYDAGRITGTIPRWNLAARTVIRQLGFAPVGTTELAGKPAVEYALDKAQWLGLQHPSASTLLETS